MTRKQLNRYRTIHKWMQYWFGKPEKCERCGKDGLTGHQIHWANKSGNYKKERSDWERLCAKCHSEKYPTSYPRKMKKEAKKIYCAICGREVEINAFQSRKKMCSHCAYDLKKARSSEAYWRKKAPNSPRHQYWVGRYQQMKNKLN